MVTVDIFGYGYFGQLDRFGKEVKRNQLDYPYSYDPFVTFRNGENEEINDTVYSDRLFQWDSQKYNKLCKKHFGNEGQYFDGRSPSIIEKFLQDYYGNKNLKLILIEQGCNVSSGYPYWVFSSKIVK